MVWSGFATFRRSLLLGFISGHKFFRLLLGVIMVYVYEYLMLAALFIDTAR